ncbi:hypothetical protein Hdeb2414_s0001g00026281 [Helianthus debilis subsp. tardiflorus]
MMIWDSAYLTRRNSVLYIVLKETKVLSLIWYCFLVLLLSH